MNEINIKQLNDNMIEAISHEWMLVTAGTPDHFNTMTASWGGVGFLWNKPVAFIFIRPERYTHEFIEANERLTLSFLEQGHRDILNFCGTKSGRDCDKVAATGLKPEATPQGCVGFEQARLVIEGRKLYRQRMTEEAFLDRQCLEQWYGGAKGGLHDTYVVEIEHVYTR